MKKRAVMIVDYDIPNGSLNDAIKKNAKFAKGLNIEEAKDYDVFPEHLRPAEITSRERNQINKTQNFLIKEYKDS